MATTQRRPSFPPLAAVVYSSKALRYSVPWGITVIFWVSILAISWAILHGVGL